MAQVRRANRARTKREKIGAPTVVPEAEAVEPEVAVAVDDDDAKVEYELALARIDYKIDNTTKAWWDALTPPERKSMAANKHEQAIAIKSEATGPTSSDARKMGQLAVLIANKKANVDMLKPRAAAEPNKYGADLRRAERTLQLLQRELEALKDPVKARNERIGQLQRRVEAAQDRLDAIKDKKEKTSAEKQQERTDKGALRTMHKELLKLQLDEHSRSAESEIPETKRPTPLERLAREVETLQARATQAEKLAAQNEAVGSEYVKLYRQSAASVAAKLAAKQQKLADMKARHAEREERMGVERARAARRASAAPIAKTPPYDPNKPFIEALDALYVERAALIEQRRVEVVEASKHPKRAPQQPLATNVEEQAQPAVTVIGTKERTAMSRAAQPLAPAPDGGESDRAWTDFEGYYRPSGERQR